MTHAQVTAISYGLLAFITLWGTILIPQLITQYARHGRVHVRGLAISGAVTLYGCLALAVVLLPLPGPNTPRLTQTVQLRPFQWVADIHTELLKHGLSSAHALTTLTFQQVAMNVLLFVPLGLIARLLWKRGLIGTLLIGFTISLAIEITQLTANFGTAPFAYRIFDVDDLMTNTTGAVLGWIVAALLLALTAKKTASTVDVQPVRSERIHLTEAR
ncbi:MAG: VanZ family protein [Amycolatopsis sp.]|jgi:glycopeptide antibiotics resistance protein|uniref:VanZ family protein n=1 Tax=Amycolatopsis sp. TaxID=37632 RepID=UPI002631FA6F|nr:VanZ family protein [Amycolatopsis sp.]MCU1681735.1 VanZ family protein [Amycolatopsis sp.]